MKYFDSFTDIDSVHCQWEGTEGVTDKEVLIAVYSQESYEGSAYILIERDGQLLEARDSHCSCNGLENSDLEETTWKALKMRNYERFGGEFDVAFRALVDSHV